MLHFQEFKKKGKGEKDRLFSGCFYFLHHILPSYSTGLAKADPISEVSLMTLEIYIYMNDKEQWFSQKTNPVGKGLLTFYKKDFPSKVKGDSRIEMPIVKNIKAEPQQQS